VSNFDEKGYIKHCLHLLATEIGPRPAGSAANRQAADYIAAEMTQMGYNVTKQEYPCPDWQGQYGELKVAGEIVNVYVNRFSPSCEVTAELIAISSIDGLNNTDLTNKLVVLHGDLTKSSFFPKNFDYFRDEAQDQIIALLEAKPPSAIIAISHYANPLGIIEDSDFAIPSVTIAQKDGDYLLCKSGSLASLKISSSLRESSGANLIGVRRGDGDKKVIICAHYDSYHTSPGALDNGAGIAALLLLARRLKPIRPDLSIELVAFGGEDSWYPGDALYMRDFTADNVIAAINIDGIGMQGTNSTIALFNWPEAQEKQIMDLAGSGFVSEPFYESDHGFFWPLGIPTAALTTSAYMVNLLGTIVHTENDIPAIVDEQTIQQAARLVQDIILQLD